MARGPRVVAEIGRPETPDETAARKAESSRIYRSSQTFRNLVAAMLVTLGVVAVIVLAVPRGQAPERPDIDPAAAAEAAATRWDRPIVVASVPSEWRVNLAGDQTASGAQAFSVAYSTGGLEGFVRVTQAFDADEAWARSTVGGFAPQDEVVIDGVTWQAYDIANPDAASGISYALGTQAGSDHVLVYGRTDAETADAVAATLGDQIRALEEATP